MLLVLAACSSAAVGPEAENAVEAPHGGDAQGEDIERVPPAASGQGDVGKSDDVAALLESANALVAAWNSQDIEAELQPLLTQYKAGFDVVLIPTEGKTVVKHVVGALDVEIFIEMTPSMVGGYVDAHRESEPLCEKGCCHFEGPTSDTSNNSYLSRVCFAKVPNLDESAASALWAPLRLEIQDTHP